MIADTAASYGSMARYTDIKRLVPITTSSLIGFSGELSDWQYLSRVLQEVIDEDIIENPTEEKTPIEIHNFVNRVMHNYRSKANPLYNSIVVGGIDQDTNEPFLGCTDLYGTHFADNIVATGFGMYIALPLLRTHQNNEMSYEEAKKLLEDCQRVLLYRHCNTINKFTLATITKENGIQVTEPYTLTTEWSFSRFVQPTKQEDGPAPRIR